MQALPPECHLCQQCVLSVQHILVECNQLNEVGSKYFGEQHLELKNLIGDEKAHKGLFTFSGHVGIYKRIKVKSEYIYW